MSKLAALLFCLLALPALVQEAWATPADSALLLGRRSQLGAPLFCL